MRWRSDPRHDQGWILEAHGTGVARLARDGRCYIAWIRYADVNVLGRFARLEPARRFVLRELWSAAGELVDHGDHGPATSAEDRSQAPSFTRRFGDARENSDRRIAADHDASTGGHRA
ncbi:MAG TPA: hypothetical protein VND91_00055 [Candidatus Saccharimonadia bacterium]|nr:hypothetical protein [Candidatus Saccharimonadia bacterium]